MPKRSVLQRALVLFVLTLMAAAAAAQGKALTPELILSIRTIVDTQISPDGNSIALQVSRSRRNDEKPGSSISEIWMMSAKGGSPWRFSINDKSDRSPQWSPDGKSIAFLSQRGESSITQVYVIPMGGGEAAQLTNAENSVLAFKWSPDGSRIAYTMTDPKTRDEEQNEKEGRDWTVADKNYKYARLYVIDMKSKQKKVVTPATLMVHDFDWAPDGKQFVLGAARTPLVDDSYMQVKLMLVSADGGEPKQIVDTQGKLNQPRWSPDGKWISWLGATAINDPYAGSVFIISPSGGTAENLLKNYEGTATWLGWQPGKPSTIVITCIERQANVLYTMSIPEKRREPLLNQPLIYGGSPSFSRDGRWIAVPANTPKHPNEVFCGEVGSRSMTRLTNFNPQLADLQLGEQEVVKWKSVDGWDMEGVVVKPVGFQRGRRYPTVMCPHGGPESADLNGWFGSYSRWGQMLAGRGFVTLYPNYRGSIGRGPTFAMADHRDLMGKEFQDMLAGIDYLVEQGITDRESVGVGGGSYGGYTSAWAATYASERFKASVAWMGISNWYSMTGVSDIFWENSTVHWDAIMYDNFELYLERSPIRHIKKANTPTLIIHGAVDPRVPIGQSQELYTALKWKGVPVEFVTYPREGHGVSEAAHQLDFMTRVTAWFEKYLKVDNGGR
jgi:dipeptidyl aminopeptidase/acylaminoacyl peptidase